MVMRWWWWGSWLVCCWYSDVMLLFQPWRSVPTSIPTTTAFQTPGCTVKPHRSHPISIHSFNKELTSVSVASATATTISNGRTTYAVITRHRNRNYLQWLFALYAAPSSIERNGEEETTNLPVIPHNESNNTVSSSSSVLPLHNVVCLVTGASRGIGKGIAVALGAQGAIVYLTGTTTTTTTTTTTGHHPQHECPEETIEQTAYEIQQLGGTGIPICCDHANDTQVYQVLQQIEREYGYLDILVNNAFRFPTLVSPSSDNDTTTKSNMEFLLRRKFWQQGAQAWDSIHTVGLRSHYITTCAAMPLLLALSLSPQQQQRQQQRRRERKTMARPLIVMISSFGGLTYSFNVAYGVGKAGVDRMVKDMAIELADEDICVVSLWPGLVRTERTERSVQNGEWDEYVQLSLDLSESPQFTGRAVVALATDSNNRRKSGTVQVVAELATEYDFVDVDGRVPPPPSIRSLRFLLYNYVIQTNPMLKDRIPFHWIPDLRLPFWFLAQGRPPPPRSSDSAEERATLNDS